MIRSRLLLAAVAIAVASGCSSGDSAVSDSPPDSPELTAAAKKYEGYHDIINCGGITGWAWDPARPDEALQIDIYDGNKRFATVTAGNFRQDLLSAGKGNGKHGFLLNTPAALKDGRSHEIRMKYAGTQVALLNGPRVVSCQ